jgi:hypothetical protein
MESYVGLDVSLRRTSICVVDQTGKVLSEGTVNSTPEAIVEFVKLKAAGAVRIGLERGRRRRGCGPRSRLLDCQSFVSMPGTPRQC